MRVAGAALVTLLTACGPSPSPAADDQPAEEPTGRQLYQIATTVLESRRHRPMLCPVGVLTMLPPECGNVPITNWDWDAVAGEQRTGGTIWGSYRLLGTYDGESFTVTRFGAARAGRDGFDDDAIEAPCPEPDGGWQFSNPSRASERNLNTAEGAAQAEQDFAGFWIDHLSTANVYETGNPYEVIATAAFTGDLERHEADLRQLWGGPLCMVEHARTYRELRSIQKDLSADGAEELQLDVLSSAVDVIHNVVEIHVVALDDEARQALEDRYGEGAVRATAALEPVSR